MQLDLGDKMARTEGNEDIPNHTDGYLDLRGLSAYSSLAVPTLRDYIHRGTLPHYKLPGKIIVKRSEFDRWLEQFKVDQRESLDTLVEDALSSLKNQGSDRQSDSHRT
jgi:excisionase family DNA binding protein